MAFLCCPHSAVPYPPRRNGKGSELIYYFFPPLNNNRAQKHQAMLGMELETNPHLVTFIHMRMGGGRNRSNQAKGLVAGGAN